MIYTLKGHKSSEHSASYGGKRLANCKDVLKKYGIDITKLRLGTLNIKLDTPFHTPNWQNIIHIPCYELDKADPIIIGDRNYRECWELIPVIKINNDDIKGYIYRTTTNYHGDTFAELITANLEGRMDLSEGALFELVITDGKE